jgi:hypothetical protein
MPRTFLVVPLNLTLMELQHRHPFLLATCHPARCRLHILAKMQWTYKTVV